MKAKAFDRLAGALKRLPGIGPKQAQRMAVFLMRAPSSEVESLVAALRDAKASIKPCRECFDLTDKDVCDYCGDPGRDKGVICVVEEPQDVVAIERSRGFQGVYHVLHGCLSPLDGIGAEGLKIKELVARLSAGGVREVILATDADTEGEATALYLTQLLRPLGVRLSRIAQGVPLGGDLDYIDERTLSHALTGRREV
jgi:recombination protein RecR